MTGEEDEVWCLPSGKFGQLSVVHHPKCRVIFSLDIRARSCARYGWRCDVGKESVKEYGNVLEG
jgi:hypothetical protein